MVFVTVHVFRLLVRTCLKVHTICNLTTNVKVEKQDNVTVLGQGQPHITFLLENGDKHDTGKISFNLICFISSLLYLLQ